MATKKKKKKAPKKQPRKSKGSDKTGQPKKPLEKLILFGGITLATAFPFDVYAG